MCILAIEGQYAVFLQPEFPSGCTIGVTAVADAWITGSICCLLEWQTTPFFFFFVCTDIWPIRVATEIWGDIYCGATGKYIFFFPWWEWSPRDKGFLPWLHVLFCLWMNLWCCVGAICVHESTRIQAGRAGGRSLRSDDTAEWRPATELQSDSYLSLQLSFFRPRIQRGHD